MFGGLLLKVLLLVGLLLGLLLEPAFELPGFGALPELAGGADGVIALLVAPEFAVLVLLLIFVPVTPLAPLLGVPEAPPEPAIVAEEGVVASSDLGLESALELPCSWGPCKGGGGSE